MGAIRITPKEDQIIKFKDPELAKIMLEHFGALTYAQAAQLNERDLHIPELRFNDNIKTFNEFQYFTGVESTGVKISSSRIVFVPFLTKLEEVTLPKSIKELYPIAKLTHKVNTEDGILDLSNVTKMFRQALAFTNRWGQPITIKLNSKTLFTGYEWFPNFTDKFVVAGDDSYFEVLDDGKSLYQGENLLAISESLSGTFTIREGTTTIIQRCGRENGGYDVDIRDKVPDFAKNWGVTVLDFPTTLKTIQDRCFQYSAVLNTIICRAIEPPTVQGVFANWTNKLTNIYVPQASIDKYKKANWWKDKANIIKDIETMQ